ncbi:MAG: squalene/phytoene synthase family protein [Pseudomonadota bacterium]
MSASGTVSGPVSGAAADQSIDLDAARAHASAAVKKSGTSFAAGMAILPKLRRQAMHAIYAFCREVDDIADDDGLTQDERLTRLAAWRQEIDRLYAGVPEFPAGLALLEPVAAYRLPKNEFIMMIEGMEMDARGPVVAPSMETLLAYTRRVAGAVGLLSMPAFDAPPGEVSDRFALALGDALQLTNILRDVAEDALIGRLYLPKELLEKYDAPTTPEKIVGAAGLPRVAEDLGALAAEKFAAARAELPNLDWRTIKPALLMMGAYEAYLLKMQHRGWDRAGEPVELSKARKIAIAARYALFPPRALTSS